MDLSSDDSFVWTNASNVSSDTDSDSILYNNQNGHCNKKQLKDDTAMEAPIAETKKAKKRKHNQSVETDSEEHSFQNKKKIKTDNEVNKSNESKERIVFEESTDDSFMDIKVKSEELSASETSISKPKKKKKKQKISETFNESDNLDEDYLNFRAKQEITTDSELNNSGNVKKSKKNKKRNKSDLANGHENTDEQYLNVRVKEESYLSDSTIVRSKKKKKNKQSVSSNYDDEENNLEIRVKEEESSFNKSKSKKKKQSIESDIDEVGGSNEKKIEEQHNTELVVNTPKKNKNLISENTEVQSVKKPKKSKKDKTQLNDNNDSILSEKLTPNKQKNKSNGATSNTDEEKSATEHVYKTPPPVSHKKRKESLQDNTQDTNSNKILNRKMSNGDSSEEDRLVKNITSVSKPTPNSLVKNQTQNSDSSDENNSMEDEPSKAAPKSPQINKQPNKTILKRAVSKASEYSCDEDKEKSPEPVSKSQNKEPPGKDVSKRAVRKHSASSNDSDTENTKKHTVIPPDNKNISKTTVSKSAASSDENSSNEARDKTPEPTSKSPKKKGQASQRNSKMSDSDSSEDERSAHENNSKSVAKSPSKRQTSNTITRKVSTSSMEDSSVENKNKSVSKSPTKRLTNNISKRTISTSSDEDSPVEGNKTNISTRRDSTSSGEISPVVNKTISKSPEKNQNNISKVVSDASDSSDEGTKKTVAEPKTIRSRGITDRILFETDESDMDHDISKLRLKKFLQANSNLHPITNKPKSDSIITDDDEIWVLKCPHDLNVKTLKDSKFILDKKCKFKMNGDTYHGSVENYIEKIAVTSFEKDKYVIKNFNVNGVVHVKRRVPKQHIIDDSMLMQSQNHFIPLPETKCRHPLFGPHFKKAIKVPKQISRRLKGDLKEEVMSPEQEKRERKKLKKRMRASLKEEQMELVEEEAVPEVKKKAKKLKHDDTEVPHKKAKKKKHNESEVWDSHEAIEESLFNY